MNSEGLLILAVLGSIGVSLLAVMVGAWLNPEKGVAGWLMLGSPKLLLVGLGLAVWHTFDYRPYAEDASSLLNQIRMGAAFGGISLALALFAAGFLMDCARRR